MYYFYSGLCNRIRYNCCWCFWLIIQIYSPANRVFPFSKCGGGGTILIMCTQYIFQHFLHAMYFRCYNNYMFEENDNNKVMFYFLSPNVLFVFVFKVASWNVLFFLRNSVLCIWLSNEGINHPFHLSFNFRKWNFFCKQREFTITIKTCWKCCVIIP